MFNKVYIIDDDEVTLYLTGLVLSLYSPDCTCVNMPDAMEALTALKQDVADNDLPSLIFLDLNMPVMDGHQFLSEVNKLFPTHIDNLKFYVLTSSISESDRNASLQYRMVQDVIEKPLTLEKLEEISTR